MGRLNYFAESEQAGQERFRNLRDRLLSPVIRCLVACRVTPDMLSAVSLLLLVPAAWFLLTDSSPSSALLASLCVLAHVLIDAFDGPLARATGKAGPAGAFTDICVDHTGLLVTACLLPGAKLVGGVLAAAYVAAYTVAIAFTIWLNMIDRPFRVIVRTKYVLYGLLGWYGITGLNWLEPAVAVFSIVHAAFAFAGFFRVRRYLREQTDPGGKEFS